MNTNTLFLTLAFWILASPARGEVVINEILYHAPDDLDLEYVELHNAGTTTVDLSGWMFAAGIRYTFGESASLEAGGYLVLASRRDLYKTFYGVEPHDVFAGSLANSGEALVLARPGGEVVESVVYGDREPWPLGADGYSASLERICPRSPAGDPANWAPSPLSDDSGSRPGGTPGARNESFSPSLPPVVRTVSVEPAVCRPGEAIDVGAVVEESGARLASVELLYRVVEPGREGEEIAVPMEELSGSRCSASVPGQESGRIVRIRVRATDTAGAVRLEPPPHGVRPAESVWVGDEVSTGKIPVVQFFNVGAEEFQKAREYLENQGRWRGGFARRGPGPGGFGGRGPGDRGPGDRGPGGRGFGGPEEGERGPGRGEFGRRPGGDRPPGGFGARGPGGFGGRGFSPFGSRPPTPLPPRGRSAFVHTDPQTGVTRLFDFVHIVERKSGYKVRLHRDRPLDGATTLNVLHEPDERSILTEALAYDLYRLAGNETPAAGYVRVLIDGKLAGYHLIFEQPNGAFFRRQGKKNGNLYKVIWQGSNRPSPHTPPEKMPAREDIVSRHEKKSNPHDGYDDLITLLETLEETQDPEALWGVIQEHFEVEQVINYFAVNMLLSHWDGFFNNYFLYHDVKGSGKWTMHPWDQDSTWGHRMSRGGEVFAEMPLTFGMEGDAPPGAEPGRDDDRGRRGGFGGFRGFGGGGAWWWRPGGEISRPLLANPEFRKRFLARVEELVQTVYTEEVFGPKFDALRSQLEEEVRLRARTGDRSEEDAVRELDETLAFFREHLVKRREFLLESIARERKTASSRG